MAKTIISLSAGSSRKQGPAPVKPRPSVIRKARTAAERKTPATLANPSANKDLKTQLAQAKNMRKGVLATFKAAEQQLALVDKNILSIEVKIAKEKTKARDTRINQFGGVYEVEVGDEVKKTAKTLASAMKYKPRIFKSNTAVIRLVQDSRVVKLMVWSSTDPVSGKAFKGFSWFWASATVQKKYG